MPKDAQPKRNVYVGGLEEQVNEEILHAAFVPFGDIVEVREIPIPIAVGDAAYDTSLQQQQFCGVRLTDRHRLTCCD